MTPRTALSSIAAALAVALAGLAVAAPPSTSAPSTRSHGVMQKLDLNQDGVIDRSEAAAHPRLAAKFEQLDKNADGRLDANERPRWQGKHGRRGARGHGGMMRAIRLDTDGDGRISKVEASQSPLAARFDAIDRNRDGYLVGSELRAGAEQRRSEHAVKRREARDARFAAADANGDGKLSRAEAEAHMPHMSKAFAFLDEDRDGFLTRAELQSASKR